MPTSEVHDTFTGTYIHLCIIFQYTCICCFDYINSLRPIDTMWWHRFGSTLAAWRHQAITWTNVGLIVYGDLWYYLSLISQEVLKMSTRKLCFKKTLVGLLPHLSGVNELTMNGIAFCIIPRHDNGAAWWRHQMETFSALLALCAGNSPVTSEFPAQRPVTRSFNVFFDLHPNKRLSKQSWGWWFETPSLSLWRHCNGFWNLLLRKTRSSASHTVYMITAAGQ